MCMGVCLCVCHCSTCVQSSRRPGVSISSPLSVVSELDSCGHHVGPLQVQQVLSTAELSLRPLNIFYF